MVLGTWLSQVADSSGPALVPGEQMICFVVQRTVVAAGEGTLAVPQTQPPPHGLCEPVAGAAYFQRGAVPGIHEHAVKRSGSVGYEIPCHGSRDGAITVQHRWFVRGTEEGKYRDGDQDFGAGNGDVSKPLRRGTGVVSSRGPAAATGAAAAPAEGRSGEKIRAKLGEGAILVGSLEAPGNSGVAVPDGRSLVCRQVCGQACHAVLLRSELEAPLRHALCVPYFDAVRMVAFAPDPGLAPEAVCGHLPCGATAGSVRRVRVEEVGLQRGRGVRVEGGGLLHHDAGVLPRHSSSLECFHSPGQRGRERVGLCQKCTGGTVADGQEAAYLRGDGHFLRLHRDVRGSDR